MPIWAASSSFEAGTALASPRGVVVHDLQFRDETHLNRSAQDLLVADGVEDCLVEAESLRLRFVASAEVGAGLIEEIYLDGGLTWCSRHELIDPAAPSRSVPRANAAGHRLRPRPPEWGLPDPLSRGRRTPGRGPRA